MVEVVGQVVEEDVAEAAAEDHTQSGVQDEIVQVIDGERDVAGGGARLDHEEGGGQAQDVHQAVPPEDDRAEPNQDRIDVWVWQHGGHPTEVAGSFQARPESPLLDDRAGFRYMREGGPTRSVRTGKGASGYPLLVVATGRIAWGGRVRTGRGASRRAWGGRVRNRCMPLDGGKAYSIYDAMRRMLEPLRRDWEKFTPAEREVIIKEIEAFLRSVKPDENAPR